MTILLSLYTLLMIALGTMLFETQHSATSRIMKFLYIPLGGALMLNIGMFGLVYIYMYQQEVLPSHIILDWMSLQSFLIPVYILWILFDIGMLLNVIGLVYFSFHYPFSLISHKTNIWMQRILVILSILLSTTYFFRKLPVLESEHILWLERAYSLSQIQPFVYFILLSIALITFIYQMYTSFTKISQTLRLSMIGMLCIFLIAFITSIIFIISSIFPTDIILLILPIFAVIWLPIIVLFMYNYMFIVDLKRIGIYLTLMTLIVVFLGIIMQNQHLVSLIFDFVLILAIFPLILFIIAFLKKEETYLITQKKANKELSEIVEVKDTFIHMTAHQIRSPLLVLEEYLRVLLEGEDFRLAQGEDRSNLVRMYSNVERLKTTVNNVSLANNISENHHVFYTTQDLNLIEIITDILNKRKELTHESDTTVIFDYTPQQSYHVQGDSIWLQEACSKIIDNALLFTSSRITITLNQDTNNIHLYVTDDGIGITEEEQEHIFTRFYRSQRALQIHPDGSGLGLYLAQYIISQHQGSIEITSNGEHQGTQCHICIPLN